MTEELASFTLIRRPRVKPCFDSSLERKAAGVPGESETDISNFAMRPKALAV